MKKIFLIISIITSFYACNVHFNNSELEWLPYSINDTLIFKSNTSNYDTIIIVNKTVFNESFKMGSFDQSGSGIHLDAKGMVEYEVNNSWYKVNNSSSNSRYLISIYKSRNKKPITIAIYYRTFFTYLNEDSKIRLNNTVINKNEYSDVLILSNINECLNDSNIEKIYWSKKFGLIKYEVCNGEIWELISTHFSSSLL